MPDEIQQRITVDAGQATSELKEFATAEGHVANMSGTMGAAARAAAADLSKVQEATVAATAALGATGKAAAKAAMDVDLMSKGTSGFMDMGKLAGSQNVVAQSSTEMGKAAVASAMNMDLLTKSTGGWMDMSKLAAASQIQLSSETKKSAGTVDAMAGSVGSLTARWVSYAAAAGVVVRAIGEITRQALESVKAVSDLGQALRGLAINTGGATATKLYSEGTAIAADMGMNVQGRAQLFESMNKMTDLRPGMSRQEIVDRAKLSGQVQRLTSVGGADNAKLLLSMESNLGLSPERAANEAAVLLGNGFNAQSLKQIVERVGRVGGQDFLALLNASRQSIDVDETGRQVPALIESLMGTDKGKLPDSLKKAHVTKDMTLMERITSLTRSHQSGELSDARYYEAIGGTQNERLMGAFGDAIKRDAVKGSMAEIANPNAIATATEEMLKQPNVRAAEREGTRQLMVQVGKEKADAGSEHAGNIRAANANSYMPDFVPDVVGAVTRLVHTPDAEETARDQREVIKDQAQENIGDVDSYGIPRRSYITNIHIGQQYNVGSNGMTPTTAPAPAEHKDEAP